MGAAAAAGLLGTIATGNLFLIIGSAITGLAGMALGISIHRKEMTLSEALAGKVQRWESLFERKKSIEKRMTEINAKVSRAKDDVDAMAKSLNGKEDSNIIDTDENFIIIDGMKLDKKMKKISSYNPWESQG